MVVRLFLLERTADCGEKVQCVTVKESIAFDDSSKILAIRTIEINAGDFDGNELLDLARLHNSGRKKNG